MLLVSMLCEVVTHHCPHPDQRWSLTASPDSSSDITVLRREKASTPSDVGPFSVSESVSDPELIGFCTVIVMG